jgi:CHASE3 domain sensor protein
MDEAVPGQRGHLLTGEEEFHGRFDSTVTRVPENNLHDLRI